MESCLKGIEMTEVFGTAFRSNVKPRRLLLGKNQLRQLLIRLWLFTKTITEYGWGIYIGALIGCYLGLWGGYCYVEHIKPGYLYNCADLGQAIAYFSELPFQFAGIGKLAGVVVGAVAIAVINNMLLCRGIISSYKNNVNDPRVIAQSLGTSERQVRRKINKLVRRKKIRHKMSADIQNNETLSERGTK